MDEDRRPHFGPYAIALRSLLYGASEERENMWPHQYTAYRSLLVDETQFNDFRNLYKAKAKLALHGFTSASLNESHALAQMQYASYMANVNKKHLAPEAKYKEPIRIMIHLKIEKPDDNFVVNSAQFSPYH